MFISEIVHTEDSFLLKLYYKLNFATEPVLIYGGIYGGAYGKFKNARLSNKKAIISTTTGSSGDIHKQVLFHISHGIVEYTGMQCLDTLIAYEIDKDQNSRDEYIEFFKNKIKYI